jgi:hypothetical protein
MSSSHARTERARRSGAYRETVARGRAARSVVEEVMAMADIVAGQRGVVRERG